MDFSIYEEHTKCTYTIRSAENCSGRYVRLKQRLRCQHKTNFTETYSQTHKTKNTNCYSKIKITLRAIKGIYQDRNKTNAPDKEIPCIIELTPQHNHSIQSEFDFAPAFVTDRPNPENITGAEVVPIPSYWHT